MPVTLSRILELPVVQAGRPLVLTGGDRLDRPVRWVHVSELPDIAPLLSEDESSLDMYRNRAIYLLCLSGLSGTPQISMPLAGRLGAPLGISIMGPRGSDLSLVALAARLAREAAEPSA